MDNISFVDLIEKKRDGLEFNDSEIRYIIDSINNNLMPDYQLSALIMAIYFKGMSLQEIAVLSDELMLSGDLVDLSIINNPKIGKYSIGGVGDKSSLVLNAIAASCGVVIPCMTSVEEDLIIKTSDKLSSIPGFKFDFQLKDIISKLQETGCLCTKKCKEISPVDDIIYNLRKNIAAIPSVPLMTASILSQKFAQGSEGIVVDIKWGNGSYIKNIDHARQLARSITKVGKLMNKRCVALLTDMNQPLGDSVGFALEIEEAINLLKGKYENNLYELILKISMEIVRLGGVAGSTLAAKQIVQKAIESGLAFENFVKMITAQGGKNIAENPELLPKAKHCISLPAPKRGYIHSIDSKLIAQGVELLSKQENEKLPKDRSVGVLKIKKIGTQVKQGEPLLFINYNNENIFFEKALTFFQAAYRLAPKRPKENNIIVERIA